MERRILGTIPPKCTGCHLCESVCSLSHEERMNLTLSRIQIDPSGDSSFFPRVCHQCEKCPPSQVCPNEAFLRDEGTGVVTIVKELCDQCGLCISECPFSAVFEGDKNVLVCDLCHGNPRCVEVCQKQALLFTPLESPAACSGDDGCFFFSEHGV